MAAEEATVAAMIVGDVDSNPMILDLVIQAVLQG